MRKAKPGHAIKARDINSIPRTTADNLHPSQGVSKFQSGDAMVLNAAIAKSKGGFAIPLVANLPPLPVTGCRFVIWGNSTMIAGGTGDGQIWVATFGDTRWYPLYRMTSLSGAV